MYEDPVRWGGMFQSYSQLTMLDLHTQPHVSNNHLHHVLIYCRKHELYCESRDQIHIGPDVQSIVSLTSSLVVKILTITVSSQVSLLKM